MIKAKTRVAALEVEAAFLNEKQEQLELKKSPTKAKKEDKIYEQINNEQLFSTPACLQTESLPTFPVSSLLLANTVEGANITSLTTQGSVLTVTTAAVATN